MPHPLALCTPAEYKPMEYIVIYTSEKKKEVFKTKDISYIVIHNDNIFIGRYGAPGTSIDLLLGTADDAGAEHITIIFNTHGK